MFRETGPAPRFVVERWLQPGRLVQAGQYPVVRQWLQTLLLAQPAVPAVAYGHMPHLVPQNDVQDVYRPQRLRRAYLAQLGLNERSGIQPVPDALRVLTGRLTCLLFERSLGYVFSFGSYDF